MGCPKSQKWGWDSNSKTASCVFAVALLIGLLPKPAQAFAPAKPDPSLITQATPAQLQCRNEVAATPSRVAFGFDGLAGYDGTGYAQLKAMSSPPPIEHQTTPPPSGALLWGMIAQGAMQVAGTHWYYYSEDTVQDGGMPDPVRCLYEWATRPYSVPGQDKPVFNTVALLGFSYGGHAIYQVANHLQALGISVSLMVSADPRAKFLQSVEFFKPGNVGIWDNFFERNEPFLSGQQVSGASEEEELTSRGYSHQAMPGSDEVTADVRERLASLHSCRSGLNVTDGEPSLRCQ